MFFRDTDKQDRRNLLLSLLSQLSARSDLCCDILYRIYLTHDKGAHKPTDDVLIQILKETLTLSNHGPIYIIMDALDECPNTWAAIPQRIGPGSREGACRTFPPKSSYMCHESPRNRHPNCSGAPDVPSSAPSRPNWAKEGHRRVR